MNPRIWTDGPRTMPGVRTSESTESKSSGKYEQTLCRYRETIKPEDPEDPEDTNMSLGGREPMLMAVGHKPRLRRRICR